MCGVKVLRCPVTSGTLLSILQNRNFRALNGLDLFRGILYVFTSKTHADREGNAMPMIDIYAVAGTFADPKQLAIEEVALARPAFVRKMVLASSAPKGAPGMHGWAPWVIEAVGSQERTPPDKYISVFFAKSKTSSEAGAAALQRMFTRAEHDTPTSWQTRTAQYDAVCEWGIPNYSLLQRLEAIEVPVFVANGDSDPMILP